MAKATKKTTKKTAKKTATKKDTKPAVIEPKEPETVVKTHKSFTFPARVHCIRCGSSNVLPTEKVGNSQYYRCNMAVCRITFSVEGKAE